MAICRRCCSRKGWRGGTGSKIMAFNATRRNRNIGTAKQGHGRDNRLVIPQPAGAVGTWKEQLGKHQYVRVDVSGKPVDFFVEDTTGGCVHACSVNDVATMLSHVPDSDRAGLNIVVLRQPTRKQRVLAPAWGRLIYFAELASAGSTPVATGPAVLLEAIDLAAKLDWSTSLPPNMAAELERLKSDGHIIDRVGHRHVFSMTAQSVRATQLYRTLLHEVGHWADWLEKVETPCARGGDFDALADAYFARPQAEREAYAHRYADGLRERLEREGAIPFAQSVASTDKLTE